MANRRPALGNKGEQLACNYVQQQLGWNVLHQNWRSGHLEVDIIATDEHGTHHIVEVKTRTTSRAVALDEILTFTKQKRLLRAADLYASQNPETPSVQIDLICVIVRKKGPLVLFFPDAVCPSFSND